MLKDRVVAVLEDLLKDSGKWSLSRGTSAVVVLATLTWVTYLVLTTHALPDLTAPGVFIGAGAFL